MVDDACTYAGGKISRRKNFEMTKVRKSLIQMHGLWLIPSHPSHIPSFSSPNVSAVGCPLVSLNLKQSIPAITPIPPITVNGNTSCTAIRYWATQGADAAPRRLTTTINPCLVFWKWNLWTKIFFFFSSLPGLNSDCWLFSMIFSYAWVKVPHSVRYLCRNLSLIHIWRCRRYSLCRSRWSPYH